MKDWKENLGESFEGIPVDGWIEQAENGFLYVELFANSISKRGYKAGDYVMVKVVTKEELEEANAK